MKKALIIKLFKVLWNNYVYSILKEYVSRSSNTWDDKILEKVNELLKEL